MPYSFVHCARTISTSFTDPGAPSLASWSTTTPVHTLPFGSVTSIVTVELVVREPPTAFDAMGMRNA